MYTVQNLRDREEYIYDSNNLPHRLFGIIKDNTQTFLIYESTFTKQLHIEELKSNVLKSEIIQNQGLEYIEDDKLWTELLTIAVKNKIVEASVRKHEL